jgi:RNA polymerase sigma-70 factor (ECF subfamily)
MTGVDLEALRRGEESAFRVLVHDYHPTLLRLALIHSPTRAIAEEAVQETWLTVFRRLDTYAGRASLRTWICRILINTARRRSMVETRSMPFSSFDDDDGGGSADPDRFVRSGPRAGRWQLTALPGDWSRLPEDEALSRELRAVVADAIAVLPPRQREVITLRDVEGWSTSDVSELLEIEDGNQRVLLHRARCRVRLALEDYLGQDARTA